MFKTRFHHLCIFGLSALLLLSLTGRFFPLGDSLAVFRLWISAGIGGFLFLTSRKSWHWPVFAGIGLIFALHLRHGFAGSLEASPSFSIYQKNIYVGIDDSDAILKDIQQFQDLDFVTLQEIADPNRGLMVDLKSDFPHQHNCPFGPIGGSALLSRWPIVEGSRACLHGGTMAIAQTQTPHGLVWLASSHLYWPFPHPQAKQVQNILPGLKRLDGPVIIAGDFNMVPWSYSVHEIERASDTHRLAGTLSTFRILFVGLPIDHVLAPNSCKGKTQRRPKLGSDHHGVYAQIACDLKPI